MTRTLPLTSTLGTMLRGVDQRAVTPLVIPPGPSAVDVLWEPLGEALSGATAVAPLPSPSETMPATLVEAIRAAVDPESPVSADTAAVLTTSGSTGHPRGVVFRRDSLDAMTQQVNDLAGGEPAWVLTLPVTSIGGFNVVVRASATGRKPVAVASLAGASRFTDEKFSVAVHEAAQSGRPVAVSLVPAQLPRLLASEVGRRALRSCSLILVGGAALAPQAVRQCLECEVDVTPTYGMTETSGGCVFDGLPLQGVTVRIDPLDDRIFVNGPMLATGYRDGNNEAFRDGWLRTNDRGRCVEGRLRILGRLDDIVTVRGVNVDLISVQDRVCDHPDVKSAAVVAAPDADADHSIHVAYTGDPIELADIRAWVTTALGSSAAPRTLTLVDEIPITAAGKVDTRLLAKHLGIRAESSGDFEDSGI